MKVTYNWLKDFVEIKIPARQVADKLTMAGLEVTSLEEKDGDFVFEIEVTSNRPDCLSVIGLAREVAAITGKKLRLSQVRRHKPQIISKNLQPATCGLQPLSIKVENKKDCLLYTAKIIEDVKVKSSPDWLKRRLELVGCRSTNSIVDITNYILFEWGEPLHAFDLDKLSDSVIIVRRAKQNENITTIDDKVRTLNPDILVIADTKKPVAIAGIMGGKDTEVTESTKNILLEAAVFNPILIRRARQKLGMQTDSSYRFERGVDLETVESASKRAAYLIQGITQGRCVLAKSASGYKAKKRNVNLDVLFVCKILGANIRALEIKKILNALGFKVRTKSKNNFKVEIPFYRQDVNTEIDLIEEIARIFGYKNIPQSLPRPFYYVEDILGKKERGLPAVKPQVSVCESRDLISLIKNVLVGLGLNEVITYSLIDHDLLISFGKSQDTSAIEILNPLSKEQEILRPKLIPSLIRCVASNLNQKQNYINIFEVAKVFTRSLPQPEEKLALGIALCGIKSWLIEQGLIKEEVGFLHLKGILEMLFERLGIKNYNFTKQNTHEIGVLVNKDKVGVIVRLRKEILDPLDIKNKEAWATELSLDRLFSYVNLKKKFAPLPVYPGILRDISFILKDDISVDDILKAMKEKGRPLLQEVKIVDYYKGKQIPAGFKGLTISCLYRAHERTLTELEINPIHSNISSMLIERFSAQIRA